MNVESILANCQHPTNIIIKRTSEHDGIVMADGLDGPSAIYREDGIELILKWRLKYVT